jgi:hypothetical protein
MSIPSNLAGKTLEWRLTNTGYEIRSGNEVIALMTSRGQFSTNGTLSCRDQSWNFKRSGLWKNGVSVTDQQSNSPVATFTKNFTNANGEIRTPNGIKFRVTRNSDLSEYQLLRDRTLLISCVQEKVDGDPSYTITIDASAADLSGTALLLVLLGCVIILQRIDSANSPSYM